MSHCLKVMFEKILIDYENVNIVYFDQAHPVLPIFLVFVYIIPCLYTQGEVYRTEYQTEVPWPRRLQCQQLLLHPDRESGEDLKFRE